MAYLLARQPIYDREGKVVAYEVFLRKKGGACEYPKEVEFSKALYVVVNFLAEFGVEKVAKGGKVVINFALESVLNKTVDLLPFEKVVFNLNPPEVSVGEALYERILERLDEIVRKGGEIVLSEELYGKYKEVYELSHGVEFTAQSLSKEKVSEVLSKGKKVLVKKIESEEDYNEAYELGGDYFKGIYLSPPEVLEELELAPFLRLTLFRLMGAISSSKSLKEVAEIISSDVGMTVRFLRFVNSAYFSRRKKIEDVYRAVSFVGLESVKKFVLLLTLNDFIKVESPELWKKSLIRGYVAEELAREISPNLSEKAFLVGLFSLLNKILGVSIPSFLAELNFSEDVIKAFTEEDSPLAKILRIAVLLEEASENGEEVLEEVAREVAYEVLVNESKVVSLVKEAILKAGEVLNV